jgi:predicted nucleotidyltransferase
LPSWTAVTPKTVNNSHAQTPDSALPVDMAPDDWELVLCILHEQAPGTEVWAFGSRARRTAKPYSDLDLVLITNKPLSLAQLACIKDAFDSSDLPIRVDLLDWASASDAFRRIIEQDRVLVQSATLPT